jgi:type I restriction enzyme S subunit
VIGGLKPYTAMKDPGVPWLGEVPEHWEIQRLKRWTANVVEQTSVRLPGDLYVALEHVEGWTGRLRLPSDEIAFESQVKRFQPQDVLFGKLRPYLAKVFRPSQSGVCVGEFLVLRPRGVAIHSDFLEHLLRSAPVIDLINSSTFGAKMPRADWDFIGNVQVPVPTANEQRAIVRFLDSADRLVRHYIADKRKLIKCLNEQKQVIVQHTVTRGLDPNVRFKPSGLGWLGDVPEHWEIRRNGQLFAQRKETGFPDLPILEVSLRTGIRIRNLEAPERKQVMSDRSQYKRAMKGDIAYNMMRMWQGAVDIVPVDGLVSPAYVVAKPLKGVDSRYYGHLFRTFAYMQEVNGYSRGIVKDRNRLYWEDFKQMPSPHPPFAEQVAIADAIEQKVQFLVSAVENVLGEINLISEYRTCLIADVVTGKLDVRAVAAALPEVPEEVGDEAALQVTEEEEVDDGGDSDVDEAA